MKKYFLFLGLLGLIGIGCGDEQEPIDESFFGYAYYPLEVGKYVEYKSDSINYYNLGSVRDTVSGYVREEYIDQFTDQTGMEVFTIRRSFKRNLPDPWLQTDIWSASMDSLRAYRTEENLKFIKLVFPVTENKRWDGHTFFDETVEVEVNNEIIEVYAGWNHKIEEVDEPYEINDVLLNETALVRLVDNEDGFKKLKVYERYAKDIGLIEKTMTILETQNNNTAIDFEQRAEKGFIHTLTLIDYN